ncbi:MAG: Fe-S protein assembly co-chaperone HscB [Polyangiaceae bacterium]|nr:Fe-S protein assembly co-chaperone HscB [Polyangiaceae bacterium]
MSDPFQLLGFEHHFALSAQELELRHRDLSAALHPDRFSHASPAERRAALNRAIAINEAARILKNPVQRGELLLSHYGVSTEEEQHPPASPALLMEMMEKRERLRTLTQQADIDSLEKLVELTRGEEKISLGQLEVVFERLGAAAESGQDLAAEEVERAYHHLSVLRYLRRFFEEADASLDELEEI